MVYLDIFSTAFLPERHQKKYSQMAGLLTCFGSRAFPFL